MTKETYTLAAERLDYNPESGLLFWKTAPDIPRQLQGKQAGSVYSDGYLYVTYNTRRLLGHRLAWIKLTGALPDGQIDHINMIRSDNRQANLRQATLAENNRNRVRQSNNTSGHKGVTFHKATGKYQAKICVNKRRISLGYFADVNSAAAAYEAASKEHHGQFARH